MSQAGEAKKVQKKVIPSENQRRCPPCTRGSARQSGRARRRWLRAAAAAVPCATRASCPSRQLHPGACGRRRLTSASSNANQHASPTCWNCEWFRCWCRECLQVQLAQLMTNHQSWVHAVQSNPAPVAKHLYGVSVALRLSWARHQLKPVHRAHSRCTHARSDRAPHGTGARGGGQRSHPLLHQVLHPPKIRLQRRHDCSLSE